MSKIFCMHFHDYQTLNPPDDTYKLLLNQVILAKIPNIMNTLENLPFVLSLRIFCLPQVGPQVVHFTGIQEEYWHLAVRFFLVQKKVLKKLFLYFNMSPSETHMFPFNQDGNCGLCLKHKGSSLCWMRHTIHVVSQEQLCWVFIFSLLT